MTLGTSRRSTAALRRACFAFVVFVIAPAAARGGLTLRSGDVLLALEQNGVTSVERVDTATNSLTPISEGGHLTSVSDMAVRGDGTIFVTDRNAGLIRINPATGAQTVVASGATLHGPQALVLLDNSSALTSGTGITQRVDLNTGGATMFSDDAYLGLAKWRDGQLAAVAGAAFLVQSNGVSGSIAPTDVPATAVATNPSMTEIAYGFKTDGAPDEGRAGFNLIPNNINVASLPQQFDDPNSRTQDLAFLNDQELLGLYLLENQDSTTIAVSEVSLDRIEAGAQWHDLFTATGAPSQLSASAIAVVPGGGAQAIALPAAAGPGLMTLVFAGWVVTWRRARDQFATTLLIVKIGSISAIATPPMIAPITTIIAGSM